VTFGYQRPYRWLPEQRALLSAAVELIGQAVTRADLYETQYGTSHLLQRSLLPHTLPTLDNFRLGAQYQPGVHGNAAGGDFYDAFTLPGDQLAVVLGDVAGHDVHAAALMGQVRAAVRAFAQTDPAPTSVLRNLHRLVTTLSFDGPMEQTFVTMVYGIADSATHTVTLASAGHPAPLVRRCHSPQQAATAEVVALTPGPPLGVDLGVDNTYPTAVITLAPGDTLLLFSDGVIERRDHDIDVGTDTLITALSHTPTGDARSLAALLTQAVPGPTDDDIAVLTLERAASPSRYASHDMPPEAQAPGRARRWLLHHLGTWQLPDDITDTAALCLTELTTNALLHAGTHAHINVDLTDERLLVTVTDTGVRGTLTRAEPRDMSSRGRGLNLIAAAADTWGTEPTTRGTCVWFELLLTPRPPPPR
jgi:serine phosphatase RsbU (regulator of sigma subunit)/anti-sigma regulatory factor (Ser/Thr protein kinase)